MNDILAIAKGISKYHIGETAGFPFSRTTMKVGKMDCVIPTTLESNVVQLHQFLYGQENFGPSSAVKNISASISKETGLTEPGKNTPTGGSSSGKKGKKQTEAAVETAPAQTEAVVETTEETKETVKETTVAETKEQESGKAPTNEDGSLIGPGAKVPDTKEETKKEETTKETKKPVSSEKATEEEVPTEPETNAGPGA